MGIMGSMGIMSLIIRILPLIHQANYLIDQQLRRLETEFVEKGGLRERMTRVRLDHRNHKSA